MYQINRNNLHRQYKALKLLQDLLEEEYVFLQAREIDAIMGIEFSIHELLRQIANERLELKKRLSGVSVLEYASMLGDAEQLEIETLFYQIDALEQSCAQHAAHNTELSLALYDQGQELLEFLHAKINATDNAVHYGPPRKGKVKQRPEAALITGNL